MFVDLFEYRLGVAREAVRRLAVIRTKRNAADLNPGIQPQICGVRIVDRAVLAHPARGLRAVRKLHDVIIGRMDVHPVVNAFICAVNILDIVQCQFIDRRAVHGKFGPLLHRLARGEPCRVRGGVRFGLNARQNEFLIPRLPVDRALHRRKAVADNKIL